MSTIAKLNAKLTAEGSQFVQTMDQAARTVETMQNRVNRAIGRVLKPIDHYNQAMAKLDNLLRKGAISLDEYKARVEQLTRALEKDQAREKMLRNMRVMTVAAVAGAAAIIALAMAFMFYVGKVSQSVVETYRAARAIGVTTTELYALQQALHDVGSDEKRASDILLNLSKNLQSTLAGNSAFANVLQRIGLNAKQLASMRSPDALKLIADQIAKIEDAETRAAIATQIFGDDAAALLPLLVQGGAAFDAASKKADNMGRSIDDIRAAQIEDVQIQWENLWRTFEGLAIQVAQELIPFITHLIEKLPELGVTAHTIAEFFGGAVGAVIGFIAFLQGAAKFAEGVARSITAIFHTIMGGIVVFLKGIIDAENFMRRKAGFKEIENPFEGILKEMREDNKKMWAEVGKNFEDAFNPDVLKILDGVVDRADKIGKKSDAIKKAGGSVAFANINGELFKRGLDIINENRTPLERFNDRMAELNRLLQVGAIDWVTYSRASSKALGELESAHQMQNMNIAGAVRAGTVEAYTAVVKSNMQEDMRFRESPEERVRRILEESKQIEKQQLKQQQRTADAIENIKVAKFG